MKIPISTLVILLAGVFLITLYFFNRQKPTAKSQEISLGKSDTATTHQHITGSKTAKRFSRNGARSSGPQTDSLREPFFSITDSTNQTKIHIEVSGIPDTLNPLITWELATPIFNITRIDTVTITKEITVEREPAFPTTILITTVAVATVLILILK